MLLAENNESLLFSGFENIGPESILFNLFGPYYLGSKNESQQSQPAILRDVSPHIIEALNNGDHEAFDYIYLHYSDSLTDFLFALTRSREEAKEITQEVFASLWVKRGIFDPAQGIKRYLFQLAKFHAFNYFDKIKVQKKYEDFLSRTDTHDLSADALLQGDELALLIEIAISRMPPRQRQVFKLNREQNMSYQEIADLLGISKNKVRNYISLALKGLRELLTAIVILIVFS